MVIHTHTRVYRGIPTAGDRTRTFLATDVQTQHCTSVRHTETGLLAGATTPSGIRSPDTVCRRPGFLLHPHHRPLTPSSGFFPILSFSRYTYTYVRTLEYFYRRKRSFYREIFVRSRHCPPSLPGIAGGLLWFLPMGAKKKWHKQGTCCVTDTGQTYPSENDLRKMHVTRETGTKTGVVVA